MPRGNKGKSRVRGGSTHSQPRARAPKGSSGAKGGEMTRRLTRPSGRP